MPRLDGIADAIAARGRVWCASVAAALMMTGWPQSAVAEQSPSAADTTAALHGVERELDIARQHRGADQDEAKRIEGELSRLVDESVATARLAQQCESELGSLRGELDKLAAQEVGERRSLTEQRRREGTALAVLERISIEPPAARAWAPTSPLDAMRGAMLIGGAVPVLGREADRLAASVAALRETRREKEATRTAIADRQAALDADRHRIDGLVAEKRVLLARADRAAESDRQRVAALAGRASDLRDLLQRLEQQQREAEERDSRARSEAESQQAAAAARGLPPGNGPHLRVPAAGRVQQRFGEGNDFTTSKGIAIATAPGATIVAPRGGRVEFAGPFKAYGQILIIDDGRGYHLVLAGIDRLYCAVGQTLVTGEPVGAMSNAGTAQRLYFELRHNGQPIDPTPYLDQRN